MSCALQASRVRLTCQGVRRLKPKNKSQGIQEPNLKPAQKENNPQPQPETRRRARVASSAAAASSTPSVTDCFPLFFEIVTLTISTPTLRLFRADLFSSVMSTGSLSTQGLNYRSPWCDSGQGPGAFEKPTWGL